MLIWHRSEAGSIRERNQDTLVRREDDGVVLLVDGRGPAGRELSAALAAELERELVRLPRYGRPEEAPERLRRIFAAAEEWLQARQVGEAGLAVGGVDVGAAVLVEGQLLLAGAGTVGLLARSGSELHGIAPQGLPSLGDVTAAGGLEPAAERRPLGDPVIHGPLPVTVGDWVLLLSEGLLVSQPLEEIARVAALLSAEPDETAAALFHRATQRYDGDDRSMVLARFLPRDLTRRYPPDTVLSVDLDRRFALPLWQPLAVIGGAFLAAGSLAWFAWRKLRRL